MQPFRYLKQSPDISGNAAFNSGNGTPGLAFDTTTRAVVPLDLSGYATAANLATLTTTVAGKEPAITAGTTAQYWRGDKSWQTLNAAAVHGSSVAQNAFYGGPSSGGAGAGSLRALVAADIPSLNYLPLSGGTLTGNTSLVIGGSGTQNSPYLRFGSMVAGTNYYSKILMNGGAGALDMVFLKYDDTEFMRLKENGTIALSGGFQLGGLINFTAANQYVYCSVNGGTLNIRTTGAGLLRLQPDGQTGDVDFFNNKVNITSTGQTKFQMLGSATNDSTQAAILLKPASAPAANYQALRVEAYNSTTVLASIDGAGVISTNTSGGTGGKMYADANGLNLQATLTNGNVILTPNGSGSVMVSAQLRPSVGGIDLGKSTNWASWFNDLWMGGTIRMGVYNHAISSQIAGTIGVAWENGTLATRQGSMTLTASDFNAVRTCLKIQADGSAANIGFLGAAPVARQTVAAAATDAATTQTLVNNIRTALINLGLCA